VHQLGTPAQALALDRVDEREPGPGEAIVDVRAIGLNFPDLLLCSGGYQERPALPFVPGYEAAGLVRAVGPGSAFSPGDAVIVVPELPDGAMQERLTVPDAQLFPVPAALAPELAAVLHIAYATAHVALHHRGGLGAGETVLVTGAAGGVGLAAVQLAVAAGARVIATASGAAKRDACVRAGAELAVEADDPELVAAVREATAGRGADVVVDVVGGEAFQHVRRCVAFEGRIVLVGFTAGSIPAVPANHVLLRNYSVVGLHLALYRTRAPHLLRAVHAELLDLLAAGAIAPRIHAAIPFAQAPRALELIADRSAIGRVVLEV
jgi:NADPH:quinone reductase-like Zn-dependent oxidoreductase